MSVHLNIGHICTFKIKTNTNYPFGSGDLETEIVLNNFKYISNTLSKYAKPLLLNFSQNN